MSTKIEICNLALSHLGVGKRIGSLDESSREALSIKPFYEPALREVLEDFAWPFATRIVTLALVEEEPNDEWGFSYRLPADCLFARRILSGSRNDDADSRVPYRRTSDDEGGLILTDAEDAQLEYTAFLDDPALYPASFVVAFSALLAYYIAPQLTSGDPFKRQEAMANLYQFQINKAQANAANEERRERPPESEFMRGRE